MILQNCPPALVETRREDNTPSRAQETHGVMKNWNVTLQQWHQRQMPIIESYRAMEEEQLQNYQSPSFANIETVTMRFVAGATISPSVWTEEDFDD